MSEKMLEALRKKNEKTNSIIRLIKVRKFLTLKNYVEFLSEHGYELTAWDEGRKFNYESKYNCFSPIQTDCHTNLLNNFVLVGQMPQQDCYVIDIANDNRVRIIRSSYTVFKISRFFMGKKAWRALHYGDDKFYSYTEDLERDLSKDWIKYLVRICPEFADYQTEDKRFNICSEQSFEQ